MMDPSRYSVGHDQQSKIINKFAIAEDLECESHSQGSNGSGIAHE